MTQATKDMLALARRKEEVLQAALDFISSLTGMKPPPIEVAPPEHIKSFKDFADKVSAIFESPSIEAVRAQAAPAWLPIESAPRNGTPFIALDGRVAHEVWFSYTWGKFVRTANGGIDTTQPTHWMPLPPPPGIAPPSQPTGEPG